MPSADSCAAIRSPRGSLSSEIGTRRRPPQVSSIAFPAHLPDLQPWSLMDMDFVISRPLVRPGHAVIWLSLFVRSRFLVVCVKFSNLIMVLGDAGGEPPVSVAAVAARWVDRLQLLEVELGNGVQLARPASSLRGWPAGCRAKRGIRPVGRSVPLPPPPSVWAAAGGAAPAARAACGCPGAAGHGVAPGVRLGSSARRRCEVWACSHPGGNRDCHVCQLAQAVGQAWHQEPVSLFDRSTVSPSRPGFRGAPRAAAVKTGPTKGRATAEGGAKRS